MLCVCMIQDISKYEWDNFVNIGFLHFLWRSSEEEYINNNIINPSVIWVALFRKYWVVMMMKVKDIQYCVYINTMLYTHSTISPGPAFPGVGYDIGWDSNLIVIKSLFAQYILHYYIGFSQQNREYSIVQLKLLKEARGLGKSLT